LAVDILPLIVKENPHVRLLIAGASPISAVTALASQQVVVSGWLDDIRDAYNESRIFVAPMLSGSGMQNKLLEAMCMKLPCVTTTLAANAIGAKHGMELFIADDDQAIAHFILTLMHDTDLADAMGTRARDFVSEGFQWEATTEQLTAPWRS